MEIYIYIYIYYGRIKNYYNINHVGLLEYIINYRKGYNMKKQILYFIAVLLLLNLIITGICTAEKELPDESQKQGHLMANGTYFELNNSQYLNITLYSSNPINLKLNSIPETVTMRIESIAEAVSTQITLSGFRPLTTYHKYEDDYHDHTPFTTDGDGNYSYIQDLSRPHLVFIQPRSSTIFISTPSGGDCNTIGNWNADKNKCTLEMDVSETIQIDSDNITLDGNGYTIKGSKTGYGVFIPEKNNILIQNLHITNFSCGIYHHNIYLTYPMDCNNNFIDNIIDHNEKGIFLDCCKNILLTRNSISNNNNGIDLFFVHNSNIYNNDIIENDRGINIIQYSENNKIHNNNIINNAMSGIILDYDSLRNTISENTIDSNHNGILIATTKNQIIENEILNNTNGINIIFIGTDTNVTNNNISHNEYGIILESWIDCVYDNNIINNNIIDNDYGIYLEGTFDNLIYENVFDNSIYNAYESLDSYDNEWDNGSIGNQWFDFDESCEGCIDADNNGICDSFYYIPGGSGIDHYPIQWIYMWISEGSDGGSAITTGELQAAIHHWLEDIPVRGHILSTSDIQHIIALWLSG